VKLTDRPTLRWIFQGFQGIHLRPIQDNQKISNLTDERRNILRFFPKPCQEYYLKMLRLSAVKLLIF
ncbi:MAG: hypothetical protein ACKN87_11370, partial [Microcystis aeruginosa]